MGNRKLRLKIYDDLHTPITDAKIDYSEKSFNSYIRKLKKKLF